MSQLILIWAIGLLIMYVITLYKLFKFTFSKETKKKRKIILQMIGRFLANKKPAGTGLGK